MTFFTGTIIEKNGLSGKQFLDGMFNGTSGLVMSQIRDFTGLNTPAIQNWINRGWLSRPTKKRYDEDQVARILIINLLRETMSLENVDKLLYCVNGDAEDLNDDIISEAELYGYICDVIFSGADDGNVEDKINETVKNFRERRPGDALRLKTTLKIVYLNRTAEKYMHAAGKLLAQLEKNTDNAR
ncbi:MAG: DUF1836 domain-containing protein [Clostridia bacterium]|nr:DUF1836 domain-containing protein [Clostridia bacterium]